MTFLAVVASAVGTYLILMGISHIIQNYQIRKLEKELDENLEQMVRDLTKAVMKMESMKRESQEDVDRMKIVVQKLKKTKKNSPPNA